MIRIDIIHVENCSISQCERCLILIRIFFRENLILWDVLLADAESIIMWFRFAGFGGINVYVAVQIGNKFIVKIIALANKLHGLKKKHLRFCVELWKI